MEEKSVLGCLAKAKAIIIIKSFFSSSRVLTISFAASAADLACVREVVAEGMYRLQRYVCE